ncbi:MAG TPA: WYL domain-containing protein [Gemmatimonadaceae bacterium]
MSEKKAAKIQRLVDLIAALLAHHAPLTFERLVEEVPAYRGKSLAAQKRMFERDKLELRTFGVPIQTVGEDGSEESAYKLPARDFYLPYLAVATPRGTSSPRRVDRWGYRSLQTLTFDTDELAAIVDGAARVRTLGDPTLVADVDSALSKLAFDLPVGSVSVAEDERLLVRGAAADPAVLQMLGRALLARKRVTFDYHGMSTGASARRRVEPFGLFFLNGHWYLAGRDVDREAVRNFRVSRITGLTVNGAREGTPDYEVPSSFHLREHARSRQAWELGDAPPVRAVVEFRGDTGAARAAAALGAPVPGCPARRAFEVRRLDAFARWLLSFAGDVVPVEPPELVTACRKLVDRTRELYERVEAGGRG